MFPYDDDSDETSDDDDDTDDGESLDVRQAEVTTDGGTEICYSSPPKADLELFAHKVFGRPQFHAHPDFAASQVMVLKRKVAFGERKIKDLVNLWHRTPADKKRVKDMLKMAVVTEQEAAWLYLDGGSTIEILLHDKIIALNAPEEIQLARDCFVDVRAWLRHGRTWGAPHSAAEKIAYVLGASGVGKTVCAVKQVATHGWPKGTAPVEYSYDQKARNHATLYAKVSCLSDFQWDSHDAGGRLVDWIKEMLKKQCHLYNKDTTLRMNLAVVLDEAGATALRGFFEVPFKVYSLYEELGALVEEGCECRLIVCGTGLTRLPSSMHVEKIHLDSWGKGNVARVAQARFPSLQRGAIDAIYKNSVLRSLTTNSRAAWFLLEAVSSKLFVVEQGIQHSRRGSWDKRLQIGSTIIFDYVVDHCMSKSAIGKLDPHGRRLVASWVFQVVEQSRIHQGEKPSFVNLDAEYVDVATSLITEGRMKKDRSSVFVSPAIALVLYAMLDQPSMDANSANGQAAITPSFSLHQAILDYISIYREKV
jgi:hypothetical protein